MKLANLVHNFLKSHLTKQTLRELEDQSILRTYLSEIFPSQLVIETFMKILRSSDQKNQDIMGRDIYSEINLPKHTRDNDWLVGYINHKIHLSNRKAKIPEIKTAHIENFVERDPHFDRSRNQYEQGIVRAEIQNLFHEYPWLIGEDSSDLTQVLYQKLTDRITPLGIAPQSIEDGLVNNADLWLNPNSEIIL